MEKAQRLILINQYKILQNSVKDADEKKYYQNCILILENGFESLYEQELYSNLSDELTESESKLVLDTLDLFNAINNSIKKNVLIINNPHYIFSGFDTNNEMKLYRYAKYFLEETNYFEYVKNDSNYRSIGEQSVKYSRMIDKWRSFDSPFNLSKSEIEEILSA